MSKEVIRTEVYIPLRQCSSIGPTPWLLLIYHGLNYRRTRWDFETAHCCERAAKMTEKQQYQWSECGDSSRKQIMAEMMSPEQSMAFHVNGKRRGPGKGSGLDHAHVVSGYDVEKKYEMERTKEWHV